MMTELSVTTVFNYIIGRHAAKLSNKTANHSVKTLQFPEYSEASAILIV